MEKGFTHILNILTTLRKANLDPSVIESVIRDLHVEEPKKRFMSILNTGFNFRTDYYVKTDASDLYLTIPHKAQLYDLNCN